MNNSENLLNAEINTINLTSSFNDSSDPNNSAELVNTTSDVSASFTDPVLTNIESHEIKSIPLESDLHLILEENFTSNKLNSISDREIFPLTSEINDNSQDLDPLTGNSTPVNVEAILDFAIATSQNQIKSFSQDEHFLDNMELAFGDRWSTNEAETLIGGLADGEILPDFEIISHTELDANAAYSKETIYLSEQFLNENATNPEAIQSVVLEEIGHFVDSQLNDDDTAGDEGDIFSRLTQNKSISETELELLQAENDFTTLTINGEKIVAELNESLTSYTIESGDTLSQIAENVLGDSDRWKEIVKEDGSSFTEEEATSLQIGQNVYLPTDTVAPVNEDNNSFKENVVALAKQEWEFFENGNLKEYQSGASQRVGEYWASVGSPHLDGNDTNVPWSAAFISWVMKQAGAGEDFKYSLRHSTYITDAIADRRNLDSESIFYGYRLNEYSPQVGDLVGYSRQDGIDFNTLGNYESHTDIVVDVRDGEIDVIGGNVSNSVTKKTLQVDAEGRLIDSSQDWFVILGDRSNNSILENPQPGDSPTASSYPGYLFKYEGEDSIPFDANVKQWQQRMKDRGWNIDVDGQYGNQSKSIARQFQAEKGLQVDGIVGEDTWAAAFDTTNVTLPVAKSKVSSSNSVSNDSQIASLNQQKENLVAEKEGLKNDNNSLSYVPYTVRTSMIEGNNKRIQEIDDELAYIDRVRLPALQERKSEIERDIEFIPANMAYARTGDSNELEQVQTEIRDIKLDVLQEQESEIQYDLDNIPANIPAPRTGKVDELEQVQNSIDNLNQTQLTETKDSLESQLDRIPANIPAPRQDLFNKLNQINEELDELNQKLSLKSELERKESLKAQIAGLGGTSRYVTLALQNELNHDVDVFIDTKSLSDLGLEDKFRKTFSYSLSAIDDAFKEQAQELLEPKNIAIMAGTAAALLVPGVNVAAGAVGWIFKGKDFYDAITNLTDVVKQTVDGDSEEDFEEAGKILAGIIVTVGIEAILGTATKKASKSSDDLDEVIDLDSPSSKTHKNSKANSTCSSFIAGTEVLTPDGDKNIENIEIGDWVIADDPSTPGEIESRQVLNTFSRQVDTIIDLNIDGEIISTTTEHPFWVVGEGWIEAENLELGMLLQTNEETFVDIDSISQRNGEFDVYNFEVNDFNTYFVSNREVLVHNTTCAPKKVNDPFAVINALSDYRSKPFFVNGQRLILEKSRMKEILEHHHPKYYNGKENKSFFPKNISIDEIESLISEVLKQNKEEIAKIGSEDIGKIFGYVNGVKYQLGIYKGRIGQFFPPFDQS